MEKVKIYIALISFAFLPLVIALISIPVLSFCSANSLCALNETSMVFLDNGNNGHNVDVHKGQEISLFLNNSVVHDLPILSNGKVIKYISGSNPYTYIAIGSGSVTVTTCQSQIKCPGLPIVPYRISISVAK